MYVALGFSGAQAQEKQFLPSGNRPENPQIFRFPLASSPSMKIHRFSWCVSKSFFDTQGRGGMYLALGFSGAQAQEKQFLRSGNRPENREIFRFPQPSSPSMKIRRFSWCVSKSFFTRRFPGEPYPRGILFIRSYSSPYSASTISSRPSTMRGPGRPVSESLTAYTRPSSTQRSPLYGAVVLNASTSDPSCM